MVIDRELMEGMENNNLREKAASRREKYLKERRGENSRYFSCLNTFRELVHQGGNQKAIGRMWRLASRAKEI